MVSRENHQLSGGTMGQQVDQIQSRVQELFTWHFYSRQAPAVLDLEDVQDGYVWAFDLAFREPWLNVDAVSTCFRVPRHHLVQVEAQLYPQQVVNRDSMFPGQFFCRYGQLLAYPAGIPGA
ncbi:unnamed protein product [Mycena citricolor]|uniref:Uncharacterized protein n=1 Tax=Mycena citricolor TaxID=2018698 RepID=A0AAD2HUT4_9AGAR|nr:unnamed protein product [Mycena citricolor]